MNLFTQFLNPLLVLYHLLCSIFIISLTFNNKFHHLYSLIQVMSCSGIVPKKNTDIFKEMQSLFIICLSPHHLFKPFLLWPLDQNQLVFMFHTFHAISPMIVKTIEMRQRSGIWSWQLRYGTVFDHREDHHFLLPILIQYPTCFQSVGHNLTSKLK